MAMHHRYGLTKHPDPVDPSLPAYYTADGRKVIWSEGRTSRGRVWRTYGHDGGPYACVMREFATLREAAEAATGQTIPPTRRRKG